MTTPKRRQWTTKEFRDLRAIAGKVPGTEIARMFGRTHEAVRARAARSGISLQTYGEAHHSHRGDE